jgi:phosphate transport system permease protein
MLTRYMPAFCLLLLLFGLSTTLFWFGALSCVAYVCMMRMGLSLAKRWSYNLRQWRYLAMNLLVGWWILAMLAMCLHYASLLDERVFFLSQLAAPVFSLLLNIMWVRQRKLSPQVLFESMIQRFLQLSGWFAVLLTVLMVAVLVYYSFQFFSVVPLHQFLMGTHWSPQLVTSLDAKEIGMAFGALPVFAGTALITLIAMVVAVPIGLFSAVFIGEYVGSDLRDIIKPLIEILAGIPTVVYGYLAATVLGPSIRDIALFFSLDIPAETALAAGIMMGIMIIPYILSLSEDAIRSVPRSLKEASLALGATKAETICKVLLPAALPGIISAVLLAMSRAIGETMIVTMAAGLTAHMTMNPLAPVTTVTAQIVSLLTGDQEFSSPSTLAAYGLGMVLFVMTLCLNCMAYAIVRYYKKRYT